MGGTLSPCDLASGGHSGTGTLPGSKAAQVLVSGVAQQGLVLARLLWETNPCYDPTEPRSDRASPAGLGALLFLAVLAGGVRTHLYVWLPSFPTQSSPSLSDVPRGSRGSETAPFGSGRSVPPGPAQPGPPCPLSAEGSSPIKVSHQKDPKVLGFPKQ